MLDFLLQLDLFYQDSANHELRYSLAPAIGALNRKSSTTRHIIVAGPTQSGKSTIVNYIIGQKSAIASPLAGFTTYPQGFANHVLTMHEFFLLTKPCSTNENAQINCYTLKHTPFKHDYEPDIIVWDTPDFDSIDAASYKLPLMELSGMADLLVLVLSKEKYADEEAWKYLEVIAALKIPLIVVLNKVQKHDEAAIVQAFSRHLKQSAIRPELAKIITLGLLDPADHDFSELVTQIKHTLNKKTVNKDSYIKQNMPKWLAPIKAEHAVLKDWRSMVLQAEQDIIKSYKNDYLNQPQHYDSFKQAMQRCLELIEIPGLENLAKVRNILSTPARLLMSAFGNKKTTSYSPDHEATLLRARIENAWISLENNLYDKNASQTSELWPLVLQKVKLIHQQNLVQLDQHISQYQKSFAPEIEKTANRLFTKLKENPKLLTSLRAARASMDVLAVIIALKTAGIGLHDLILTPALLSASSSLTEGALGAYINSQAQELAAKQESALKSKLLMPYWQQPLLALSFDGLLSNISVQEIAKYE